MTTKNAADGVPVAETMALQEVWNAAGGNPGIKPTRAEVIEALRQLDEVCDEPSGCEGCNCAACELRRKHEAARGVLACPESGKHCRWVDGECQTCGNTPGVALGAPSDWIAVSERLPEPGTEVLVFPAWGTGEVGTAPYVDGWGWLDGVEDGWQPTHWQPKPAAPVGVTEVDRG